jgi:hypothetical protein
VIGNGQVRIEASSSGDLELESLGAAEFRVEASSSADVELTGQCTSIKVEASSSADVDANESGLPHVQMSWRRAAPTSAFLLLNLWKQAFQRRRYLHLRFSCGS